MSFTVDWRPSAEDELARLWVDHPDERNEITAAAAALDTTLRRDPLALGESRTGQARITFEGRSRLLLQQPCRSSRTGERRSSR